MSHVFGTSQKTRSMAASSKHLLEAKMMIMQNRVGKEGILNIHSAMFTDRAPFHVQGMSATHEQPFVECLPYVPPAVGMILYPSSWESELPTFMSTKGCSQVPPDSIFDLAIP